MFFIYNLIQFVCLTILAPFLFVKAILTPKYRGRMLRRLGKGLVREMAAIDSGRPRIWFHALSVGETASARSMIKGLRRQMPEAVILFSASTKSGEEYSRRVLAQWVDEFVAFPFDVYWVVKKFVKVVDPDLFVLIETDFWPNILHVLQAQKRSAILVNGRISAASFRNYRRFRFVFLPMFSTFELMAMQTSEDVRKMVSLGVLEDRVQALGNLKYDTIVPVAANGKVPLSRRDLCIPDDKIVWIAGSTHPGEEEILFRVVHRLLQDYPDIFLVVAPRSIDRGESLLQLAEKNGLQVFLRSDGLQQNCSLMILNTMGELSLSYGVCDLAFVGASLVPEGGHNPLEPAGFAKPVLFGPNMDDFAEISRDLLACGGCRMVLDEEELLAAAKQLIGDKEYRFEMGRRAAGFVHRQQGVTQKHLDAIFKILRSQK